MDLVKIVKSPEGMDFFLYLMVMSTMSFNDFYWEVLVAYVNGKLWQYAK